MTQNPNRYAEGLEAAVLRARLDDQQLALDVLAGKYLRAQQAHEQAHARFREIEEQYTLYKSLLRDSGAYVSQSKLDYDAQVASVAATRAFFHPMRRAPLDVLGQIFELCSDDFSPDDPLDIDGSRISTRQMQPFRLAAVCRRWREASLAHPRAWNHVELSFDKITGANTPHWVAFLDAVLARARSAPIRVCLTRRQEPQHHHSRLVRRLVTAMANVVRAQIMLCNLSQADPVLPVLLAKTARLQLAYLDLARAENSDVLETIQPLPHAPILCSLYADNVFHTRSGSAAFPLLECIRFRYIDCTDDSDVLSYMLRSMPNLLDLRLDWPNVNYRVSNKGKLALPKVKSLTLEIADECPVQQMLHRFAFTGLRSLELCGDPPSSECRLQFLRALPQKAQIGNLLFTDTGGPEFRLLLDELRFLDSLVTLTFEASSFTNDNLVELQAALCPSTSPSTWPCKRLRGIRFRLSCTFTEDCDVAIFLAIINARGAADDSADAESPDAPGWLFVHNWETSRRGPIQDRVNHAIRAAAGTSTRP
ncbi:hypothetical protein AURDEDRAFT_168626 [Auricularia subglabra TFB-10046 SS5]|nr:hypothetical protein AURDEDRAFT_168626 [Auricularia subglabra TFB-10046 SS5]